jgi:ComF family protein
LTILSALLIPPQCVLCGAAGQKGPLDLCPECEAGLPRRAPVLDRARAPLAALYAPWSYKPPLDELVRDWKFHGARHQARVLGLLLARAVVNERATADHALPDCLVPIPLHPHRQRERGFNQSLELARIVGRELRVPSCPYLLRRTRDTAPQSLQPSGQRHANLQGAFAAEPCTGLQIALIDDVFTSGNTIITAAHALLNAGALSVEAWVVARAGGGSP